MELEKSHVRLWLSIMAWTLVKLFANNDPTSQLPPESPARYVADCRSPPSWPGVVAPGVLESNAAKAPAPFINARYPPPEAAIPMLGN